MRDVDDSYENTSGSEYGIPLAVAERQWNWGAFCLGWLWCLFHGLVVGTVGILGLNAALIYFSIVILPSGWYVPSALTALVIFGANCYLGLNGYRLAWEHRRFEGGETQFFRVQRAWGFSGIASTGVLLLLSTGVTIVFISAFHAYEARKQQVFPVAATSAQPLGPAPMVLRRPPPEPVGMRPIMGGQGYRHPWDFKPSPRYRPGYGPGDVRTSPMPTSEPPTLPVQNIPVPAATP